MEVGQLDLSHSDVDCKKRDLLLSRAFQVMLSKTNDKVFIKDTQSRYVAASESGLTLLNVSSVDELIGKRPEDFISDTKLTDRYYADDRRVLENRQDLIDYVGETPGKNGQPRYVAESKYYL